MFAFLLPSLVRPYYPLTDIVVRTLDSSKAIEWRCSTWWIFCSASCTAYAVTQLVEALRYKLQGRGFDPDGVSKISNWPSPSGCTMATQSTQTVTEMSTRHLSWSPRGVYRRLEEWIYLFIYFFHPSLSAPFYTLPYFLYLSFHTLPFFV